MYTINRFWIPARAPLCGGWSGWGITTRILCGRLGLATEGWEIMIRNSALAVPFWTALNKRGPTLDDLP